MNQLYKVASKHSILRFTMLNTDAQPGVVAFTDTTQFLFPAIFSLGFDCEKAFGLA